MAGYEWRTIYLASSSTGTDDTTGSPGGISMDKRFTVPTNRIWQIQSILATAVSAAAVGNRQLQLTIDPGGDTAIFDDTNPYVDVRAGAVQAASLTYYYQWFPAASRMTAVADTDWISMPIPDMILAPLSVIRIFDSANRGTTAAPDDLDIRLVVSSRGGIR